jgi:predicted pyridoxine 5'-phosphate oxidase superfamily flavin-nucleotide-binding protein
MLGVRKQPFHEGEIAVQERTGERDIARRIGAAISSRIIPGALSFLSRQCLVGLSAAGDDGHLWTSVWCGDPGFVRSADGQRVSILRSLMAASPDDPVLGRLSIGRDVGMLAIELTSRRRLRINGTIDGISADDIGVLVRESVANCPKYIQRRQPHERSTPASHKPSKWGRTMDDERRALVERADTAFIGSVHPARGMDASHRGGAPGFIRVIDATTLRIPDYPGNSMFMTLGNYEIDSRASLAALDFERDQVVAFSGSARLRFGVENPQHPTGGTGRYWDFAVREWVQFELSSAVHWELLDSSPFNPATSRTC